MQCSLILNYMLICFYKSSEMASIQHNLSLDVNCLYLLFCIHKYKSVTITGIHLKKKIQNLGMFLNLKHRKQYTCYRYQWLWKFTLCSWKLFGWSKPIWMSLLRRIHRTELRNRFVYWRIFISLLSSWT